MRRLRRIALAVVPVLAVLAVLAPVSHADDTKGGGDRRAAVVPARHLAGNTGGRLLGDWFVQNLSLPADASPFGGPTDLCLDIGRRGKVLSPAGGFGPPGQSIEMTCTVQVGRPVLLVMTSADCSTAEPPPFYARTAVEQRRCAFDSLRDLDITSITVSVDGAPAVDIHDPRFLVVSRQRHVVFPQNPVFGATPGPATFVAAGWIAEIRGMRPGHHVVRAVLSLGGQPTPPFIVHFDVVGRGHG